MKAVKSLLLNKVISLSILTAFVSGCTTLPPEIEQLMSIGQTTFFKENQSWRGSYICDGKATSMAFDILDVRNNQFITVLHFEERNRTKGIYVLKGQTIGNTMRTSPIYFKLNPVGYSMLGFTGTYDATKQTVKGTVNSPDCTTFEMRLTNEKPLPVKQQNSNNSLRSKQAFINNKV